MSKGRLITTAVCAALAVDLGGLRRQAEGGQYARSEAGAGL